MAGVLFVAAGRDADVQDGGPAAKVASLPGADLRRLLTPAVLSLMALYVLLSLCTGGIQNFSVAALTTGFSVPLSVASAGLTGFLLGSSAGVLAGGILADRTRRHGFVAAFALMLSAAMVALIVLFDLPHTVLVLVMTVAGFLGGVIAPSRDMLVRAAAPRGAEGGCSVSSRPASTLPVCSGR